MRFASVTRAGLAAAALTVCLALHSGSAGDKKAGAIKPFLPPDVYKELVTRELKTVQESLGKSELEEMQKGKVAALMIAMYTLTAKDVAPADLAGIRAAALKLAGLIGEKDKAGEAQKLIAAIAMLKGDPSLKTGELNFKKYVPNDYDLMVTYMAKAKGGDGLHADLQFSSRLKDGEEYIENLFAYLAKKPLIEKHMKKGHKELELTGYRTASSAELIRAYMPLTKKKDRDPELWLKTSVAMRESALDLVEAAKKQDTLAMQKAASAVLDSCVQCHKMFQK